MIRRLLRLGVGAWVDPAAVFVRLFAHEPYAVWLDAGACADAAAHGGRSYLAAGRQGSELLTADIAAGTVTRHRLGEGTRSGRGAILDELGRDLERRGGGVGIEDSGPGRPGGFRLGWTGWLGYEAGAAQAGAPVAVSRYPDAALLFVDRAVEFDHATRTVTLLALDGEGAANWLKATSASILALGREGVVAQTRGPVARARRLGDEPEARWRHGPDHYLALVRECQEAIRRGDAYQLCLTNEVRLDVHPDPAQAYLAVRELSPTHRGGFLRFGELSLVSVTPEQFLSVSATGDIATSPIKGTRPRGRDSAEDGRLRRELRASEKERAENLMIVDLMRNDLSRVARLGSVSVSRLLEVESYAQVHQLVSTVEARLAEGLRSIDVLRVCFPAGSMTGAPKLSAMTILHGLEAGPRGIYSGSFGYLGLDGAIELSMVIRSVVLGPDGASIGTGGGITALSVPHEELEETRVKVAALVAALAGQCR